ncbi:hypothetical protein V498_09893 [Pseudogymnoascus sp. VKM F-4517 (FW-2822)]|nr:hypothetical protein V498_09893 [Pseudogymnoascus sp. VKM F-4517 (FW-2822)]
MQPTGNPIGPAFVETSQPSSASPIMPVTKRGRTQESPSDIDDYDDGTGFVASDDEDKPKSKRTKTAKSSSATKPAQAQTGEGGEKFWELSQGRNSRRIGISEFKGTRLINIREYYQNPAGDFLPGKKGISLPLDQYKALLKVIPDINAALTAMGETVESGAASVEAEGGTAAPRKARVKGTNAGAKEQRANIDETSDEDDEE